MLSPAFDCYLLCATPRTGSTLLCGLLESSGVAGRPASYFNRRGLHDYADRWGLDRPRDGRIDAAYVEAARKAGSSPNGVFGVRIMAETLPELLNDLRGSDTPANDLAVLGSRLGRLRFLHLRRADPVAQAVSWAKALQTHFWHPEEAVEPGGSEPHYDEALIDRLVDTIEAFESAWARWFADHAIRPFEIRYEDLAAEPLRTAHAALDHLGLEPAPGRRLQVRHRRQADQVNAEWMRRHRRR